MKLKQIVYVGKTCAWRDLFESFKSDIMHDLIPQAAGIPKHKLRHHDSHMGVNSPLAKTEEQTEMDLTAARETLLGTQRIEKVPSVICWVC